MYISQKIKVQSTQDAVHRTQKGPKPEGPKWGHLSLLWEGEKAITKGEGGRGEHDLLLGVGKGLKPWGQPKEWKQATSGDRTLGGSSQMHQRLSWLKGRDFRWNALQWGEETYRAPPPAENLGIKWHSKLWPIIVPILKNFRYGNGENPKEKKVHQ